jgi:hypothetical protein
MNSPARFKNLSSGAKAGLAGSVLLVLALASTVSLAAVSPPPDKKVTPPPANQNVKAAQNTQNIEKKTVQEKSPVGFSTKYQDDSGLPVGTSKVITEGVLGERTVTYEVTYVEGKETSRQVLSDIITTQPIDKVVSNGTYTAPQVSTPSQSSATGQRIGAVCADGSHSSATSSGACSHHGGVAYWLYN